jgi:hypothetical protein
MLKMSISGKNPNRVTENSKKFRGRRIRQGADGEIIFFRTPQRFKFSTRMVFAQGIGQGSGRPTRIVRECPILANSRDKK